MRRKLTSAFVKAARVEPGKERTVYWDVEPSGFGLVVTSSGHRSYVVQYRAKGRSRRINIKPGLGLDDARKEARGIVGAVAKGADPLTDRRVEAARATNSLQSVAEEYLKRAGKDLRSIEERRGIFERLVYPRLGTRQIGDLVRTDIVRLLDKIEDEGGPSMAHKTLAVLSRLFSWHAARDDTFRSPIVRGMGRIKAKERARQRVLSDHELRAVWQAAGQRQVFGSLVKFILLTATRRSEPADMTRGEVNGAQWIIPEERYKTKLAHLIPLSVAAQDVLAGLPKFGGGAKAPVFSFDGVAGVKGFSEAKRSFDKLVLTELAKLQGKDPSAVEMERWTLHDLRRTARTLLSRAGVSREHAERCLGHVLRGVEGTYNLYEYEAEKQHAFEALASIVDRLVHPAGNVTPLRAANN